MKRRLAALRALLKERELKALVVFHLPNVRYLTGFTGSAGACLVTGRRATFLSDFRYRTQAAAEVKRFRRVEYREQADGLPAEVRRLRLPRLAFEEEHLSYSAYRELKRKLSGVRLLPVKGLVEELRARKEEGELRTLRRAAALNGAGLADTLPLFRPGARESELALALERRLRERGAEGVAFETIVASGPRGALPHGMAAKKRLRRGELVVVDFGCVVDGYRADTTRTYCLGRASRRAREVYGVVLEANRAGIAAVRPGADVREVDAAARKVIEDAGYGSHFGHGLGHGVGLEVHEAPRLSPQSKGALAEGMVVTVEPGIYLPGWGGVRIEDMVRVTARGGEVLTSSIPKDFQVL
ncbi:MAG: M24 family metallopeptidase [Nitrospinota bacterium]